MERLAKLRSAVLETKPAICPERALLLTKAYQENEGLTTVLRRARAVAGVLREMSIYIEEGQLLVGNQASNIRSAPIFPEFSVDWVDQELDTVSQRTADVFAISPEVKEDLRRCFTYWKGKTHSDYCLSLLPERCKIAERIGLLDDSWLRTGGDGHIYVDYAKVLRLGLTGIMAEIQTVRDSLDLTVPENILKLPVYEAMETVLRAVIDFAGRYADLAEQLAANEQEPCRCAELREIARICRRVPGLSAETFPEALQSFWFVQLVLQIEDSGHSISPGRMDQYLYPYYLVSRQQGMSEEQALELLGCLFVKFYTLNRLRDETSSLYFRGGPLYQMITLGGQTRDGKDATNELSHLFLKTFDNVRLPQPTMSCRWHADSPEEWKRAVAAVVRKGIGGPAVISDRPVQASMQLVGYSEEDARDYGVVGCAQPAPMGRNAGRHTGAFLNLLKLVELTLNNGCDPLTGEVFLPTTRDTREIGTYAEFEAELERQLAYCLETQAIAENVHDFSFEKCTPNAFLSSLVTDCIGRGKTVKEGGAIYDYTANNVLGIGNFANSLTALKKVVFEDRRLALEDLLHALATNFQDQSTKPSGAEIQQVLLNAAPKFGNDDPEVDEIAARWMGKIARTMRTYPNSRHGRGPLGGHCIIGTTTASANVPFGRQIGATSDGREAFTPVADSTAPVHGTEENGPTALLTSAARLPMAEITGGTLLNIRLNPLDVQSEEGLDNLIALIEGYFDMGGYQLQFNVVSTKTLRDAQKNPQRYRDLLVKVAGYSAFFTLLDPILQEDIIARMEHSLSRR